MTLQPKICDLAMRPRTAFLFAAIAHKHRVELKEAIDLAWALLQFVFCLFLMTFGCRPCECKNIIWNQMNDQEEITKSYFPQGGAQQECKYIGVAWIGTAENPRVTFVREGAVKGNGFQGSFKK